MIHVFLSLGLVLSILHGVSAQPPEMEGRGTAFLQPLRPPIPRDGRPCRTQAIRTLDGKCTSQADAAWGRGRLAQFSYVDGSSSEVPKGQGLKSAREISNILFTQNANTVNAHGLNELFTFFGQFLDHNFAATPENEEESMNIEVPRNDPSLRNVRSLPFRRSVRSSSLDGGFQRPINTLTSAIDLVAVYGTNEERLNSLLEFTNGGMLTGKLKTSGNNLLPLNTRGFFNAPDTSNRFFIAGDHRPNEHPVLTAMHTLFLREHNRIADIVIERIPGLPPRRVFEYARILNTAQFQKIVYEEFYPAIISRDLAPYRNFSRRANPTVSDVFAGAGFRIGHTMVGPNVPRRGPGGPLPPITMNQLFFRPASTFTSEEMDNIIRGVAIRPAQEVDNQVVNLLRNFLFSRVEGVSGFDLVALNIQRGRDHNLPTFNEIRGLFGIPIAPNFNSITRNSEKRTKLMQAYDNDVDAVEAFPGLMSEDHIPGSGMGRTLAALWRAEFTRLRDGDQFFYLNTRRFPSLLRSRLRDFEQRLLRRSSTTFRDLILRNTNVTLNELRPGRDIFNVRR